MVQQQLWRWRLKTSTHWRSHGSPRKGINGMGKSLATMWATSLLHLISLTCLRPSNSAKRKGRNIICRLAVLSKTLTHDEFKMSNYFAFKNPKDNLSRCVSRKADVGRFFKVFMYRWKECHVVSCEFLCLHLGTNVPLQVDNEVREFSYFNIL